MKLIGCNTIDHKGLDSTYGFRARNSRGVPVEEPIHVHVRIRQYADAVPEVRQARSAGPDIGRLPVGSTLDCYM